jgi:membrane protease YdiL (CAAX protease family)
LATRTEPTGNARLAAALCALGGLAFYFGERALLPKLDMVVPATSIIVREASLVATSILIAYAAMRLVPLRPGKLGLRVPHMDAILIGIGCAGATIVAGILAAGIATMAGLPMHDTLLSVLAKRNLLLVGGHAGAAAFCEELVFRGTVHALVMVLVESRWVAAAVALALFVLGAIPDFSPANILLVLLPGMVLTGFYLWKRNLLICLIGHAGALFFGMIVAGAMARLG